VTTGPFARELSERVFDRCPGETLLADGDRVLALKNRRAGLLKPPDVRAIRRMGGERSLAVHRNDDRDLEAQQLVEQAQGQRVVDAGCPLVQFGFGGHCFTKSRRFSTTFNALRKARAAHAAERATNAGETASESDHNLIHIAAWGYAGSGYRKAGDALLADSSHARAREHRRVAREAAMDERAGQATSMGRHRDGTA